MEQDDFNFEDLFRAKRGAEYELLYKTHPYFDKYPTYLQQALMVNEEMQGRVKPTAV